MLLYSGKFFFRLLEILLLFISFSAICNESNTNKKYMAMADLGSSGSRIYLYQVESQENGKLPILKEIPLNNNSIDPGLEVFASDQPGVEGYFDPLFKSLDAGLEANSLKYEHIDFYAFGTAGLRIISPYRRGMLLDTLEGIAKKKGFATVYTSLLEGHEEGLFDWIAVNYAEGTFTNSQGTYCILDLGGGSAEIAYEINSIYPDVYKVKIGKKTYTVYSKSYLGLGMDFVRYQVSGLPFYWQTGYNLPTDNQPAHADFFKGVNDLATLITLAKSADNSPRPDIPQNMKIIGLGGFYYITKDKPLNLPSDYDIQDVEKSGINISKYTWSGLLKKYKKTPYTFEYLFSAEYITSLLKNCYHFKNNQIIQAENQIKDIDTDWTLGAALYIHEGNKHF